MLIKVRVQEGASKIQVWVWVLVSHKSSSG